MDNEHIYLWNKFLDNIKTGISSQVFNAWFLPLTPLYLKDNKLTLGVPNEFFRDWMRERYLNFLVSNLTNIANKKIEVEFVIVPVAEERRPLKESEKKPAQKEKRGWFRSMFPKHPEEAAPSQSAGLNPRYTFDDFVVGPSNRFAHAASLAITESLSKTYNPFFIYGGVGLGKTHLMHAIGNELSRKSPRTMVLYISSEEFTNQLINAIRNRTTVKFRQKYRNVDVLLVDDIHFIAGKEATQEEFFHTFNSLYDAHKQIIISSDRSPKEIPTLEERLISRFEWGLITDIQPPDFETRIAILRKKSEKETIYLPDELFFFLAEKIKTNIRELEGALIRVVAYAKLMNVNVTVDLAKEVLKGMIIEGEKRINVELIQKKVAQYFDISLNDMKAKKRTKTVAYPRQIAMYLSRNLTDLSLPEIGHFFGGRDHTTVLHACEKIENNTKTNGETRSLVDKLILNIKG